MSTMTFIGRTTREAMALAKARFGSDVEIVDSRQTSDGVELTANVHGLPLQRRHLQPQVAAAALDQGSAVQPLPAQPAGSSERSMSTVSFESHVRDRKERLPLPEVKTTAAGGSGRQVPLSSGAAHFPQARATGASPPAAQSLSASLAMPVSARATADAAGRDRQNAANHAAVLEELHSIRQFMAGQLETVRWFDTTRRRPSQMRLLRILMARQFSTVLSKSICDLLPVDFSDAQADNWLQQTLARTLSSFGPAGADADDDLARGSLFDRGGVFALTGPTGVGKTTTVAKIAARYAMQHGAGQVALISADVYRIGAQEQLRSFGQMLGVPVHVAHDRAALKELLGLFGDRKLVLIYTAGVSQRDSRVAQLLAALDIDPIQRIVVLNAALQAASLQDVAHAYRAQDCAGVLLSKTDEAVQIGSALDCLIRNRLHLLGFTDGQRVPEDFHAADFGKLVSRAISAPEGSVPGDGGLQPSEVQLILESSHV